MVPAVRTFVPIAERPLAGRRSILSGFIASTAMVLTFPLAYGVASLLAQLPLPSPLPAWFWGLTHNAFLDATVPNPYAALAVFFAGGLLWSIIYDALARRRLGGPEWRRGATFALVPWLFSLVVFFPLVGAGLFGSSLGAGPLPVVGNLLLHLVYGAVLGILTGPVGDRVDAEACWVDDENAAAMRFAEEGAVKGLWWGLAVGAAGSLLLTLVSGTGVDGSLLGVHPVAAVVGGALVAGSFGVIVGSLMGLSARGTGA